MKNKVFTLLHKLFLTVAVMLVSTSAFSQAIYSLKLKLVDEITSEPVSFATASITIRGEKEALKFTISDQDGVVSFNKLKRNTYVLRIEQLGYKPLVRTLRLDKNTDFGPIKMKADVEILEAASITAVGNPIVVKKDTIEYSATSFKTSDNDMLEDLLKKLPGVEIDSDGTITANGETITKITIDGKTFFLDDPQLASKNLPAKMINKIKVVDKKSDQAMFTGIDDGQKETVIDLSIKPGMMQGWFGNLMGGGGHDVPGNGSDMNDYRYQGAGMLGRFTKDSQISIILNGNNTNNRGFNDIAGNMMHNMRGGGMGRGTGGWGGRNGISTTWMAGINGSFDLFDDAMSLSGNYLYNGSDRDVIEESSKITYMDDGSRLLYDNSGYNNTYSEGHRFGIRMEHKFSEKTSILFEPKFNIGTGYFSEYSDFDTERIKDNDTSKTNTGFNRNIGENENWNASGFLLFRQRLGKAGRTFSAHMYYNFSNNNLYGFNKSLTLTDLDEDGAWDANPELINQRFVTESTGTSLNARLVYTEPLTEHLFLEANYSYGWNMNKSVRNTYNSGYVRELITEGTDDFDYIYQNEMLDSTYSNVIYNRSINQTGGFNISYQKDKFRAQIGASVVPTSTYNETTGHQSYKSEVLNWAPQAMLNYDFSDNSNMRMFYGGRSSQPSTNQLLPVPDNSNPLNVSLGNPYLEPYFNHSLRYTFRYTNKKSFTSINANVNAYVTDNAITSAQWYDFSGVQYSIPVNSNGTGSIDARVSVNSPLGKSDFSIFSMTNARYNQTVSYIGTGALDSDSYYDAQTSSFDYDAFFKDYSVGNRIDLSNTDDFINNKTQAMSFTQRLRMTYRNDVIELTLGGRTRMSKSWYTMENSNRQATWNNQIDASMNWTIPGGINIIAEADYNWYEGYTTPQEDEIVVNAEITKLLFKKKFTLALKAYDILGQSKNLYVTDASNYHQEVRNNTLGRYVILSLTYRFGTFNGRNHNGGGRPSMGGPMGGRR